MASDDLYGSPTDHFYDTFVELLPFFEAESSILRSQ